MLSYSLYYDISLISLKITQACHLLLGFEENQTIFWDFKIRNGVRITEGSDNRGPTVLMLHLTAVSYIYTHMYMYVNVIT